MRFWQVNIEFHIFIKGRVQGVGFRWYANNLAQNLGVNGWVRNNADGSVEIVAQGNKENLISFVDKLKSGPPSANVVSLDKQEKKILEKYKDFKVAY